MISFRASTTFPLFGLLVALAGCSGETGAGHSATTAQAVNAPAEQSAIGGARERRPHGGPDALLSAALHEQLNLTPAQRTTIEGAASALKQSAREAHVAERGRMTALAAAIRAGKVDPSTLPPRDMSARLTASAKALDTLHATLTKEQRVALVDAMTKKASSHDHSGWKNAKAHMAPEQRDGDHGGLHHFLAGLDLTKAQEDAIRAKLEAERPQLTDADRQAMKQRFELARSEKLARLQTFANDTFDANAFVAPPSGDAKSPTDRADHMLKKLAVVTSVLEPAQREKLAARFEQSPRALRNVAPPANETQTK